MRRWRLELPADPRVPGIALIAGLLAFTVVLAAIGLS